MELEHIPPHRPRFHSGNRSKSPLLTAYKDCNRFGFNYAATKLTGYQPGDMVSISRNPTTGNLYICKHTAGSIIRKWGKGNQTSNYKTIAFNYANLRVALDIKTDRITFHLGAPEEVNGKTFFLLTMIHPVATIG